MALFKFLSKSYRIYQPSSEDYYRPLNELTFTCIFSGNHHTSDQHMIGQPSLGYRLFLRSIDNFSYLAGSIGGVEIVSDTPIEKSTWTYAAIIWEDKIFKLYQDGELVGMKMANMVYGGTRYQEYSIWAFNNTTGGNSVVLGLNYSQLWEVALSEEDIKIIAAGGNQGIIENERILFGDYLDDDSDDLIYGIELPFRFTSVGLVTSAPSPFEEGVVPFPLPVVESSSSSMSTSSSSMSSESSSSESSESSSSDSSSSTQNRSSFSSDSSESSSSDSSDSSESSSSDSSESSSSDSSKSSSSDSSSTSSSDNSSSTSSDNSSSTSSSTSSSPSSVSTNSSLSSDSTTPALINGVVNLEQRYLFPAETGEGSSQHIVSNAVGSSLVISSDRLASAGFLSIDPNGGANGIGNIELTSIVTTSTECTILFTVTEATIPAYVATSPLVVPNTGVKQMLAGSPNDFFDAAGGWSGVSFNGTDLTFHVSSHPFVHGGLPPTVMDDPAIIRLTLE